MSGSKPIPVLVLRQVVIWTWLSGSTEPRRARFNGDATRLLELLGQPGNELESNDMLVVQVSAHAVRVSLHDGSPVARFTVDTEEVGMTIVFVDSEKWLDSLLAVGAETINPEDWPDGLVRAAYRVED